MSKEDRKTLTVGEAAKFLGIGRSSAYEAVRRGEIPALRIGRRILIPKAAVACMLGMEQSLRSTQILPDG